MKLTTIFWYSIIKTSDLKTLQECYDKFVWYYISDSFDKYKTDRVLIKEALDFLERKFGVKSDTIEDILIDRKQNKIVTLIK